MAAVVACLLLVLRNALKISPKFPYEVGRARPLAYLAGLAGLARFNIRQPHMTLFSIFATSSWTFV